MPVWAAAAILTAPLGAQNPPAPPQYRFEVVSIKPSKAATATNRISPTPQGGLRCENVTPLQLIALAFNVRPFLIVDAPAWASAERFDVLASPDRAEEPPADASAAQRETSRDRLRQRVYALLLDRFGLVIRADKRTMPVYKLVVAKGGHKMTAAADEPRGMETNSTRIRGRRMEMPALADALAGILLRPVLDETNLAGAFNFEMQYADVRPQTAQETAPAETTAPTIFTAITERLGLKVESARAPAPVFIVESVRRPTEN